MTRGELIVLNKRLAVFGERFCRGCGGVHPLDQKHWYWSHKGRDRTKLRPSSMCKRCTSLQMCEQQRNAYQTDAAFRERKRAYRQAVMADPVKHERKKAGARLYKQRKRQEALAAVLTEKGVGGWQQ